MDHAAFAWVDTVLQSHATALAAVDNKIAAFYASDIRVGKGHGLEKEGITTILTRFMCDTVRRVFPTIVVTTDMGTFSFFPFFPVFLVLKDCYR